MIKIKKRPPMPWYQKTFYLLSFVFLIIAFIYLGTKNYNAPIKKLTDAESFTEEYGITKNNVFVYKNAKETLELLNTGTGIIFMAFPENNWSHFYADMLNETAKYFRVEEIWYYNFKNDRSNNNHFYRNIVRQLNAYNPILDNEVTNIYAPTVIFVRNGEIIGYDNETAIMNGEISLEDYWTKEKTEKKKIDLGVMFQNYLGDRA